VMGSKLRREGGGPKLEESFFCWNRGQEKPREPIRGCKSTKKIKRGKKESWEKSRLHIKEGSWGRGGRLP